VDDIRLNTRLAEHPKTRKLERRLGAAACWALVKLFLWVGDSRPDGDLTGLSDEDLELAVNWSGPAPLVPVLADVGFFDGESGNYRVHDWAEHQPFVSARPERVERAKAAARARWDRATPEQKAEVGRGLVDARLAREESSRNHPTRSERANGTLPNVPGTCPEHVAGVPSTHAPTHVGSHKSRRVARER
jgi:hypothetical protein